MSSSSTPCDEFNKVRKRLQKNETQQDVEYIEKIIKKINSENTTRIYYMSSEFETILCDPSKIPEATACLSKFVNNNK